MEAETGESKEEKLLVPSAMSPHALCLLLDTASALHRVRSPPLLLQVRPCLCLCLCLCHSCCRWLAVHACVHMRCASVGAGARVLQVPTC